MRDGTERQTRLSPQAPRTQPIHAYAFEDRVRAKQVHVVRTTPRNTMIRAVRTNSKAAPELWTEYDEMVATWGVTPWLAEALQPELAAAREEAMNDPVPLAADSEVVEKDSTD